MPDHPAPDITPDSAAVAALRAQLLDDLDDDVLPMAHVESVITRNKLADTAETRQALALTTIASLLADQAILVGDVVGGDPAYIDPWAGTPEDIIDRIRRLYVEHYDHSSAWLFSIWVSLNDERRIASNNTIG